MNIKEQYHLYQKIKRQPLIKAAYAAKGIRRIRQNIMKCATGGPTNNQDKETKAYTPFPNLMPWLGGGALGGAALSYLFAKDDQLPEEKRSEEDLKNAILGALAGAGAGLVGSGASGYLRSDDAVEA